MDIRKLMIKILNVFFFFLICCLIEVKQQRSEILHYLPDTERNLDIHKTLRRRPGRLVYIPFTSCAQGVYIRYYLTKLWNLQFYVINIRGSVLSGLDPTLSKRDITLRETVTVAKIKPTFHFYTTCKLSTDLKWVKDANNNHVT